MEAVYACPSFLPSGENYGGLSMRVALPVLYHTEVVVSLAFAIFFFRSNEISLFATSGCVNAIWRTMSPGCPQIDGAEGSTFVNA